MSTTEQLLIAATTSVIIMIVTWIVCIRLDNGGWVDVVWAFTIGLLATLYQFLSENPFTLNLGWMLTALWSIRLGFHLAGRIASEPEDGRYQQLKQLWGGLKSPMMAGFFGIQALAAFLFSIPALIAIHFAPSKWCWPQFIAIAIAILAIAGETIADRQLKHFKKSTQDPLAVCKTGLWRYSRHPNYFFEWLHWIAYPVLVIQSSAFWPTLLAPTIMFFLITKFSGIPPTEAQALRKRGDCYRQYQDETSAFFPWFPKQTNTLKTTNSPVSS